MARFWRKMPSMLKERWWLGLALATLVLLPTAGLGSMAVAPLSLRIPAAPGEQGSASFTIRNTGTEPITVNITLHDWWRTPDGRFQILPAGSLERSCAEWVLYSASSLELAPGEEREVTVKVTVPEDVEGDHWALLLVAEEPRPEGEEEGLTSTTRVVVTYAVKILQQDPVNKDLEAEIKGIELVQTSPLELRVRFVNTGNAHLITQGTVEIRDIFGEAVRSFSVAPFPSLPGEERVLVLKDTSADPLPEGFYYVIALLDFGGDYLIQGGAPVQIPAPQG